MGWVGGGRGGILVFYSSASLPTTREGGGSQKGWRAVCGKGSAFKPWDGAACMDVGMKWDEQGWGLALSMRLVGDGRTMIS